jgi:hypothetical protein
MFGDVLHDGAASIALGWVELAEGRNPEAEARLREGPRSYRRLGYTTRSVNALFGLAGNAAAVGDQGRAARLNAAATRLHDDLGHYPSAADSKIHEASSTICAP